PRLPPRRDPPAGRPRSLLHGRDRVAFDRRDPDRDADAVIVPLRELREVVDRESPQRERAPAVGADQPVQEGIAAFLQEVEVGAVAGVAEAVQVGPPDLDLVGAGHDARRRYTGTSPTRRTSS